MLVQLEEQPRRAGVTLPLIRCKIYHFLCIAECVFRSSKLFVDGSTGVIYDILITSELDGLVNDQSLYKVKR